MGLKRIISQSKRKELKNLKKVRDVFPTKQEFVNMNNTQRWTLVYKCLRWLIKRELEE